MTSPGFEELVPLAESGDKAFDAVSRDECLEAAKNWADEARRGIQERHNDGESGWNVVTQLSDTADELVRGSFQFALRKVRNPKRLLKRISLCAQGGYGRRQLNPHSDLDICLLYAGRLDRNLRAVNEFMVPFLWDLGFENSFVIRSIDEALALVKSDFKVFTSYIHSRLLIGSEEPYGKLRLRFEALPPASRPPEFAELERWARTKTAMDKFGALYEPEPNIKESAGGLRDYHSAMWLLSLHFGVTILDEAKSRNLITEDERLGIAQALDLLWRIRNELHFHAEKQDDVLTSANELLVAQAFGYTDETERDPARFMKDYYRAARSIRGFLWKCAQLCARTDGADAFPSPGAESSDFVELDGELYAGVNDPHWFEESPARLMSVFWESARRGVPLSKDTLDRVSENLDLVGETFRSNDLTRKFFLAICNRPYRAGFALRQASNCGLLEAYLPEFAAVRDIVRYEDFHRYPVDEHTLRAVEALGAVPDLEGSVGEFLKTTLEHLSDPYILVLALLCHDLGKVSGEEHSEEGMRIARDIGARIGLPEEDTERIAFLVLHHLLMTHIALYRDTDDMDVVSPFSETMKSENRLRQLLLLSYADMSAVAPGVWNDWKGALLMKLYFRTESALSGHSETRDEAFWEHPKAAAVRDSAPKELKASVEEHLRDLGEHYFAAFTPEAIAVHMECFAEADRDGYAVRCVPGEGTDRTDVIVCAPDHPGLFEELAGCFVSQLVDVEKAALFTRSDGMALDCFAVGSAARGEALTERECKLLEKVFRDVLGGKRGVEEYIEQSQRRIFTLLHPPVPVQTEIRFDNQCSSRYTVIDVWSGDRTGLLYDLAHVMTQQGLDIASARIVTDARRVRDSFYVTRDRDKITDGGLQAGIEEALRDSIHLRPAVAT